jgi:hypothetical protein
MEPMGMISFMVKKSKNTMIERDTSINSVLNLIQLATTYQSCKELILNSSSSMSNQLVWPTPDSPQSLDTTNVGGGDFTFMMQI